VHEVGPGARTAADNAADGVRAKQTPKLPPSAGASPLDCRPLPVTSVKPAAGTEPVAASSRGAAATQTAELVLLLEAVVLFVAATHSGGG